MGPALEGGQTQGKWVAGMNSGKILYLQLKRMDQTISRFSGVTGIMQANH
jgi:hypothetical protein